MGTRRKLRDDHFIPSEREDEEFFVGGRGPNVIEGDPSKFDPDPIEDFEVLIRRRHEWGSPPEFTEDEGILAKHPLPTVLFTFTGEDDPYYEVDCKYQLLLLRDECRKKGMYELPWNFIVGGNGTVYEARGWHRLPEPNPDAPEWAGRSFEIAHFGVKGLLPPNQAQIAASWEIVIEGVKNKYLVPIPTRRSYFYKS